MRNIVLASLLLLSACNGILEKDPLGVLDSGSFFQTADDARQAINAAYQPLMFNTTNNNFYWAFAEITSDQATTGGDGSRPGLIELDAFTYTPRTEELTSFWALNYQGISQCNTVLDRIDEVDMSEEAKNRIKGEALFLRSYYYFILSQVFGDVVLYTSVIPPDELKTPKTPRSEVFSQLIADCEAAAALLPPSYPETEAGKATRGAALALAAKTALYQKNWQAVLGYIDQIKALNVYNLVADYQDNFRENTQNNTESVWEIPHTNLELGVGNSLNQWWCSRKLPDGYGFAEVTQSYFDSFEPGDPRRDFTIASNNQEYLGFTYKNSFSSTNYSPRKYLQPESEVTQKADGGINYTAIRYAEILLWEAEAHAELGNISEAQQALETVRARARAQAVDPANALPYIATTNQATLIEAVRNERSWELGFECHRFFDLVRWGTAKDILPDFEIGKHEVFPLPQTEIDLNPQLLQNTGY